MASKLVKSAARFSKAEKAKPRPRVLATRGKRKGRPVSMPLLGEEVQAFCDEHDLRKSLGLMLEQIEKHLHPIGPAEIGLGSDPENFEEYVVVTVKVSGEQDEVLDAYQRYIRGWVEAVDWEQARWFRLVYIPS